ncbi:MAG: hypothetical protein PUK85_06550 [Clostridia bacterium]|nr:hypothetical protein [Clostridia bacterium]
MYIVFSDNVRKLRDEVFDWIVDGKFVGDDFVWIFKENTPESIKKKYAQYAALVAKEWKESVPEGV